jgi:hypothetical protein
MTKDASDIPDDAVRTAAEFEAVAQKLLQAAHRNEIDVAGSWVLRNGDSLPDWEVQVHELAKE